MNSAYHDTEKPMERINPHIDGLLVSYNNLSHQSRNAFKSLPTIDYGIVMLLINTCTICISCTESWALNKVPFTTSMEGKGLAKPVLSGGENHTERLGKCITLQAKPVLSKVFTPYSLPALVPRILIKCNSSWLQYSSSS